MKRFIGSVFDKSRTSGLVKIALLCVFWWIAQTIASVLVLRIVGIFTHSGSETWAAIDRLSPVPHFLTSLSAVVMSSCKGMSEIVAPFSVAIVQFGIFVLFTWLVVREVARMFAPERKITFGSHIKMALTLVPVYLSISLLSRFIQIPLESLNTGLNVKLMLTQFLPDFVSLAMMSAFLNSFLFGQSGFSILKSIVLSLQSTSKDFLLVLVMVFSIAAFACVTCGALFSSDVVLNGLYEPFRYAVSALCWASTGLIWIYSGLAYHQYVESERLEPLPASKGA